MFNTTLKARNLMRSRGIF